LYRKMRRYYRESRRRGILLSIKRRKPSWIFHTLRRNCHLRHVIEGKIEGKTEVKGRRERRSEQILDDLQETRRCWKLKEKALDRTQ